MRLDFSQLDPVAKDFYLVINASQTVKDTGRFLVGQITREIPFL